MRVRSGFVALALSGAIALGGCSLLPSTSQGNGDAPAASQSGTTHPPAPASEAPPTPAQELSVKVKESLGSLAAGTKSPSRDQMKAAMVAAGANPDTVEVSVDITPTGLAVDAMEAADALEGQCVVGQVRDGQASVTVLPVLASGRCFVGDVH
ncbi:DUF6993 domain-containing protein [Arthrobacter stackebrandtii]|nr:hypothetical protein [Arthrobacter stackebrandtii]